MFKENIDECVSNPCVNGNCTDQVNNFTCSCEAGYSGDTCNGEVNMCNFNFKMTSLFWCEHITYSSENIDGCLSNPCQNGGVCNDGVNSYTCSCVSVYGGDHCESM